jgi:Ca2+-binding RTX toxin-like protein
VAIVLPRVDSGAVERAARFWRVLAWRFEAAANTLARIAGRVGPWEGETAETYRAHRLRLTLDLRAAAKRARDMAAGLDSAAGHLRAAQRVLAEGGVVGEVADWLSAAQAALVPAVDSVTADLGALRDRLLTAATFTAPADDQFGIIVDTGRRQFVISTAPGANTVEIGADFVVVDGKRYVVPDGLAVVVRTGGGNDVVTVPEGFRVGLTVLSGDGDDRVTTGQGDDRVYAGDGNDLVRTRGGADLVQGGAGADRIVTGDGDDLVHGGAGRDVIRGLGGNDRVLAGDGRDYADGGTGDDLVHGGAGRDVVAGGGGDDRLFGGRDDDVLYAGDGDDRMLGGDGNDTAYGQTGEYTEAERFVHVEMTGNPGDTIIIEGDADFQATVLSDLDVLRSSPAGRPLLEEMDRIPTMPGFLGFGHASLTITATADKNGADLDTSWYRIYYNPHSFGPDGRPPVIGLFHEMAHVFDAVNGTAPGMDYTGPDRIDRGVPNYERTVVGLGIDDDNDRRTPDRYYEPHPRRYTEPEIRLEMGEDPRLSFNAKRPVDRD